MALRTLILLVGSLTILNMLTQAYAQSRYDGESYLDRYGPGSSSNNRPSTPNRGPGRGGSSSSGGSRRPHGAAGQSCPRTLSEWEYDMEGCMRPLSRLGQRASMYDRCRAYRDAEPCVDAMKTCQRDNPQIQYYKSKSLETWKAMEREAKVYGVCHDIEGGGGSRNSGGSRRPSGGAGQSCPRTLSSWEYAMENCMRPLTSLSKQASMLYRCRAYRDAEPCVDAMKTCQRDNPQIQYYKSESLETWKAMEREAEVYGVCHDID